jgi:predicted dinucleotide-binding enzyme
MANAAARAILGDNARLMSSVREAIAQADVAVIVTPWPEYAQITADWVREGRPRFIIDCWRQLALDALEGRGRIVHLGQRQTIGAAMN